MAKTTPPPPPVPKWLIGIIITTLSILQAATKSEKEKKMYADILAVLNLLA